MRSFGQIFAGRLDCYGKTIIKGKHIVGTKLTDYESKFLWDEVTDEHFNQHLDPDREFSLGIVPVDAQGMCNWMCLDYDEYSKGRETGITARGKVDALGLPLVPCYSKSFGVHLFAFFKHPVSVEGARGFMESCRDRMGLPTDIEIFPKQDVISDPTMSGSFLNLPYYNGNQRCGVNKDGTDMSFEDFLKEVHANELSINDLEIIDEVLDEVDDDDISFLDEAPPCVQSLIKSGIQAGGRSNAIIQCAIFAKKRHHQINDFDWQSWVLDVNAKYTFPPMTFDEIAYTNRSVERADLGYLCKQQPLVSACDKKLCKKREFGILCGLERTTDFTAFQLIQIKKIKASPPYYLVTLSGYEDRPIKVTSKELTNPRAMIQSIFETLDLIFPTPKASQLADMVNECSAQKGDKWTEDVAPEEMDDNYLILAILKDWIMETISPLATMEELESNNPIWRNNKLFFKGNAFIYHLQTRGERITKTKIFEALRSKRATDEWFEEWKVFEAKSVRMDDTSMYLWILPLKTTVEGGWFEPPAPGETKF